MWGPLNGGDVSQTLKLPSLLAKKKASSDSYICLLLCLFQRFSTQLVNTGKPRGVWRAWSRVCIERFVCLSVCLNGCAENVAPRCLQADF